MKSVRKIVYASLLAVSALNLAPAPASAQEARGVFTLPHEVHWQNALVPAGEYTFSLEARGPSQLLLLRQVSGGNAGFMLMVGDAEPAGPAERSSLVLVKRSGQRFVSSMGLPQYGLSLRFAVPAENREIAQATVASASKPNR
ncbi:MAG TPA: hypothetical protein VMU61_12405 [Candidatus Aquilonibacter sp.]|nr:hypothetical protein [Candidatus Aquilonibacter sp.]